MVVLKNSYPEKNRYAQDQEDPQKDGPFFTPLFPHTPSHQCIGKMIQHPAKCFHMFFRYGVRHAEHVLEGMFIYIPGIGAVDFFAEIGDGHVFIFPVAVPTFLFKAAHLDKAGHVIGKRAPCHTQPSGYIGHFFPFAFQDIFYDLYLMGGQLDRRMKIRGPAELC